MTGNGHLWAVGYDDIARAAEVREEIAKLGERHCLLLLDSAVAVRYPDGSLTLDGERFVTAPSIRRHSLASFFAGLALGAPPLSGAAASALLRETGTATSGRVGISDDFICEVERLMKPGTSALFVLDDEGDMDEILQSIRGLGGTVLKANVDVQRAKLIQSTLATPSGETSDKGHRPFGETR
jgi:uncharacterized membrane protein